MLALMAKIGSGGEAFDMKRLANVIHRKELEVMSAVRVVWYSSLGTGHLLRGRGGGGSTKWKGGM